MKPPSRLDGQGHHHHHHHHHGTNNVLDSIGGRVAIVFMAATFLVRLMAPQVFIPAAILLAAFTYLISIVATRTRDYLSDRALGRERGCALPQALTKRWPLGIDRIKDLWSANASGHLLDFLCGVAKDYEPQNTLYQFLLVGPRAYHIMTPPNVEAVLSTNFKDFGFGCRAAVFAPLLGSGIFTQEGAAWRHSRELLRKQFSRTQYQHLDRSFGEHVDNLLSCVASSAGPGEGAPVDLQPLFFGLTLDTTTALLFGRSVYSLRAGLDQDAANKRFARSFNVAQEGLAKRFRLAPFHWLYSPPSFRRACREVHDFVETYIRQCVLKPKTADQAEEQLPHKDSSSSWFVDEVAAESSSVVALRDQLLNVLLAGRDTTACCLSWTFRLLVRHPERLDRLRREVASVMGAGAGGPTREDIKKMPFLNCIIKESLRLYPPVPLNNREATQTTILPSGGGPDGDRPILVRRGELVVFSQYVNSRRQSIYGADACEFRPERWETGELADKGWAYFPFNGGPRRCLGEDFAVMEVSYTVVRLIRAFPSIALPRGERVEPVGAERQTLTLVLSSADGCRVAVGTG